MWWARPPAVMLPIPSPCLGVGLGVWGGITGRSSALGWPARGGPARRLPAGSALGSWVMEGGSGRGPSSLTAPGALWQGEQVSWGQLMLLERSLALTHGLSRGPGGAPTEQWALGLSSSQMEALEQMRGAASSYALALHVPAPPLPGHPCQPPPLVLDLALLPTSRPVSSLGLELPFLIMVGTPGICPYVGLCQQLLNLRGGAGSRRPRSLDLIMGRWK